MWRWRGLDDVPSDWGRCVVTVGVFDGVHRGHQAILHTAADRGTALRLPVVAVTFDPHPDTVVGGGSPPGLLTPTERRDELLADHGADAVCVLPFTSELSRLEAEEFVRHILVERLHAAAVVVGEDFRFGHKATGDVGVLQALGEKYDFAADGVRLRTDPYAETVTSTLVRRLLTSGDVTRARDCLGRPHRLEGVVVPGASRGRDLLGFPTANIDFPPEMSVPADGVYAGWLVRTPGSGGEEERWPAAVSVGSNPTFEGSPRTVEAYALDQDDLDLYSQRAAVEFTDHIRGQETFSSVAELIAAMRRDVSVVRELMSGQ